MWLLENDDANPGVRYFALRDLLDRPGDDGELRSARAAVMHSGPAPAILDAMAPDGYWVKPGGGCSPKYRSTVWQICCWLSWARTRPMRAFGRVRLRVEPQHASRPTAFAAGSKPSPSGAIHRLNGNLIWALLQLGYADDPRLHGAGLAGAFGDRRSCHSLLRVRPPGRALRAASTADSRAAERSQGDGRVAGSAC